jgi:hypothetical protein
MDDKSVIGTVLFGIMISLTVIFLSAALVSFFKSRKRQWEIGKKDHRKKTSTSNTSIPRAAWQDIRELSKLKEEGIMSEKDFKIQKRKVINRYKRL